MSSRESVSGEPSLVTRALAGLGAKGKVGAELGWRLDMLRATVSPAGIGHVRSAYLEEPRLFGPPKDVAEAWHAYYRELWEEAADVLDVALEELGGGFLSLRRGDRSTIVWQHHVMLDDPVTIRLALDKTLGHRLFAEAGLPVAAHVEFDAGDVAPARRFLADGPGACVVKPASGTGGGHGVTCGVVTGDDLVRAVMRARRWDRRLLIEQQVTGDEFRFLFLDGELLDVIRRRPPVLLGDGRSTIEALVAAENLKRAARPGHAGLRPLEVDLDCLFTLRAARLSLRSVPAAGEPVAIKSTANANGPGDNETVHEVHAGLVEEAGRAAALLGVRLAGVEVITPDPKRSLELAGGVLVEVNGTPGLHYHYLVADRERATRVAIPVLSKLLAVDEPVTRRRVRSAAS